MGSVQQVRQATKSLGTVAPYVILSYRSRQFRCRHTKAVGITTGSNDFFTVPQSVADALFLRRNNLYPKFVLNEAGAYTTDTMHRVFIKEGVNKKA